MADLVDRQTEVGGDLLIESERIPAIEDDLLNDRPITVCEALAHRGNVPSHAQEERREMGICVGRLLSSISTTVGRG